MYNSHVYFVLGCYTKEDLCMSGQLSENLVMTRSVNGYQVYQSIFESRDKRQAKDSSSFCTVHDRCMYPRIQFANS